jgi:signal recognition particle receptor subunit alpha
VVKYLIDRHPASFAVSSRTLASRVFSGLLVEGNLFLCVAMLDLFTILTSGGIVLFQKSQTSSSSHSAPTYLIDQVISNVFMQERSSEKEYAKDGYTIKWTFANELGLIFVAVYQKILELTWVDELLTSVKRMFVKLYADNLKVGNTSSVIKELNGVQCHFSTWFDGKMRSYEETKVLSLSLSKY